MTSIFSMLYYAARGVYQLYDTASANSRLATVLVGRVKAVEEAIRSVTAYGFWILPVLGYEALTPKPRIEQVQGLQNILNCFAEATKLLKQYQGDNILVGIIKIGKYRSRYLMRWHTMLV